MTEVMNRIKNDRIKVHLEKEFVTCSQYNIRYHTFFLNILLIVHLNIFIY